MIATNSASQKWPGPRSPLAALFPVRGPVRRGQRTTRTCTSMYVLDTLVWISLVLAIGCNRFSSDMVADSFASNLLHSCPLPTLRPSLMHHLLLSLPSPSLVREGTTASLGRAIFSRSVWKRTLGRSFRPSDPRPRHDTFIVAASMATECFCTAAIQVPKGQRCCCVRSIADGCLTTFPTLSPTPTPSPTPTTSPRKCSPGRSFFL
jgi:hypothetical protein